MRILGKLSELKQHQGFVKYFKNTSWLFAEKILRMTVGLFVGIWIARYLGPEKFGLFSYAQSFVALFTAFATLGLDSIVVRELVKDESRRDLLLGTAFILKLIGAGIFLVLLASVTALQNNDSLTNTLIFLIASGTLFQSFNVIDFYFQSKVLSKFVVFSNTISLLVSSIIKIYLLLNEAPLIAFAYVGLFDGFVLSCGFIYFYFRNNLSIFNWSFDFDIAKSFLKDSFPLIFSGLVISIYMKIDQVMIKEMIGNGAVGQYAAAVRLSEAWYFIPMAIASSLFPAIINAKKTNEELYYERLQKLYVLMVWAAIVIALPMTFLSDWVVELLYGGLYNKAGSVLMIHIWSGVFVFFATAWAKHMIVNNKQKIFIQFDLLSTFFNITLNLILIPKIGIIGAAIATAFSIPMTYTVFFFFYKKQRLTIISLVKALLLYDIFKKRRNYQ